MNAEPINRILIEEVDKDYYNLEDILACSTSIQCLFGRYTPKGIMALVGQPVTDSTRDKNCKAEIPLFLARTVHRTGIGKVQVTYPFNHRAQEVLRADPRYVDLQALHPYFYRLGRHLTFLIDDAQAQSLAETLLNTFLQRVGPLITKSLNCYLKPTKMDSIEKRLYMLGMYTKAEYTDWVRGVEEGCKKDSTPLKLPI